MATPAGTANEVDMEIKDHKRWTEGDAELVSSDNVRYNGGSADTSAVLRNAPKLTGPIQLHLSDPELEDARTVDNFLRFIVDHDLTNLTFPSAGEGEGLRAASEDMEDLHAALALRDLIRLLKKYECDGFLRALRERLEKDSWVREEPCSFCAIAMFLAGVELDNVCLYVAALHRPFTTSAEVYHSPTDPQEIYPRPGYHALNPSGMAIEVYDCIPRDHMLALIRAWEGTEKKNVGERFCIHYNSIIRYRKKRALM